MPGRPAGGSGGGGVLGLGPAQNTFGDATTADRAAAEALRATYQGNNAAWLALYNDNRSFWIRLVWDDGTVEQRRNAAGDDWEDVTNVVRGPRGPGPTDAQITALVAGFARATPVGTAPLSVLPAQLALDTEVTAAIDALKGGVDAAYDTLAELADARVTGGRVTGTNIELTRAGEATLTVDASGLGTTEARVNQLIQAALQAAVQGNAETGIDVTYQSDGTFDFAVTAGGLTLATVLAAILAGTGIVIDRSTPDQITISAGVNGHPTLRFGTSADEVPTAAEATIVGMNGMGTIDAYAGDMHHLIYRLDSEDDITSVLYSDDQSQTNQIGAFSKYAQTVDVGGDTYAVWVSNQALSQTDDVTLTVA